MGAFSLIVVINLLNRMVDDNLDIGIEKVDAAEEIDIYVSDIDRTNQSEAHMNGFNQTEDEPVPEESDATCSDVPMHSLNIFDNTAVNELTNTVAYVADNINQLLQQSGPLVQNTTKVQSKC